MDNPPSNVQANLPFASGRCEVCGGAPPSGHRICDNCWPDAAIQAGRAGWCRHCDRPRLREKLVADENGTLVCSSHLANKIK